jgi:8-oxo-dGTP diphosphatase
VFCQRCGGPTEERVVDGRMRPVCTRCGAVTWLDPKLAVGIIVEQDGCILLGKRADWVAAPGTWSFPAGFVERGEVVEVAAVREAREETGLTVTVGPVLGVFSEAGNSVVLAVYPALDHRGDLRAGDDLTELRWFSPTALPELAFAHDQAIITRWLDWRGSRAT